MPGELLGVFAKAWKEGGVAVTLAELVRDIGSEENSLAGASTVDGLIKQAGCELRPGLKVGDLNTERYVRPIVSTGQVLADVEAAIAAGEGASVEFKSSLIFHRTRAANDKSAKAEDLKSEAVTDSSLKTVCAFLNGSGGTLYIGVADDGVILGIEDDYPYCGVSPGENDVQRRDRWQLHLRSLLASRFHEGSSVNNAVQIETVSVSGKVVAQLRVQTRKKLSFVVCEGRHVAFLRNGNRTDRLEPYQIEDVVIERLARIGNGALK